MIEPNWNQFDGVFRAFDRSKMGTVALEDVLHAFRYPTPTALQPLKDLRMTDLALLCMTLAVDAPLSDSIPLTTIIEQCTTRSSVSWMDKTEPLMTMNNISSTLNDWIGHSLLHHGFQNANQ